MEQKEEHQSALITDHGETDPFAWPPIIWIGAVLCIIGTFAFWYANSKHSEEHYQDAARAQIWTTFAVGNPHTFEVANVRPSLEDKDALCGRINYEKVANGGWSGFTDFYIQAGVFYIAPPGGRYEKQFAALCLTAGSSAVDRPESPPAAQEMFKSLR